MGPFWSSSILGVFHFGRVPFWSSSILVVFHFGRLPFWSSSILVVFHFGRFSFWSSSILVVFHFGRLPFWLSSCASTDGQSHNLFKLTKIEGIQPNFRNISAHLPEYVDQSDSSLVVLKMK